MKSINFPRHYIGITENLENRLAKHNGAGVQSTKAYRPWKMAYHEKFSTKTEARKREIYLKKTAGARHELFVKI
ncbi:MAG: GIY-YIG nuclease family protein [Candidatus Pacebacteria bacterium]|nr:GIY-YIG nuclease family protein [Candidatus Paceibacterota bacterium]